MKNLEARRAGYAPSGLKKQVKLILYSFTPSDMNFQANLIKNCHKKCTHLEHSYVKYALRQNKTQGSRKDLKQGLR